MRDEKWLFLKLDEVWDRYFSDVPQDNDVQIVWGRRARSRLGSIKQVQEKKLHVLGNKKLIKIYKLQLTPSDQKGEITNSGAQPVTIITINSLFKDEFIPEYVVIGTIAHELAHYAHGFHSPLEQKYATPHAGGIVHKEMSARGLDEVHKKQKRWLKANWREYVEEKLPRKARTRKRKLVIRWA